MVRQERKIKLFESSLQLDFFELVRKLIPDVNNPKEKLIKGCSVIMPETVFFREGKIELILQNDREFCLSQDTKTKYTPLEVRKRLPDIVEQRRKCKEYREPHAVHKMAAGLLKPPEGNRNKDNAPKDSKEKEEEKHQPFAIIRFTSNYNDPEAEPQMENALAVPGHQVLTRQQLADYFSSKAGGKQFWNRVYYIQTALKMPQFSIGKPVYVDFFAPMNEKNEQTAAEEIKYDFKSYPEDLELLEQGRVQDFCRKQILKMCYYMQRVRSIEVLQMKAEFLVDESGSVWFSFAKDIHYRELKDRIAIQKVDQNKAAASL